MRSETSWLRKGASAQFGTARLQHVRCGIIHTKPLSVNAMAATAIRIERRREVHPDRAAVQGTRFGGGEQRRISVALFGVRLSVETFKYIPQGFLGTPVNWRMPLCLRKWERGVFAVNSSKGRRERSVVC